MPRPPLPIGSHGKIGTSKQSDGTWRTFTRFRFFDGQTRQIERSGSTEKRAVERLESAIEQLQKTRARLTVDFKFREVAAIWLGKIAKHRTETTHGSYKQTLNSRVLDRIGDLRLREISVLVLEEFFEKLEEEGYSAGYRRLVRTTIRGTLQVAVRHGLLDSNPAQEVSPIESGRRKVRALTTDERRRLFAGLDRSVVDSCSNRASDLPDLARFLLGTGCRIGEALAARWKEVNLTDQPVVVGGTEIPPRSVWINGNIVNVKGKGLVRHDGKTENAVRMIALPEFVVTMLTVRWLTVWSAAMAERHRVDPGAMIEQSDEQGARVRGAEGTTQVERNHEFVAGHLDVPVFPSHTLGWKNPNNVRRSWRVIREEIGFGWVTPHAFRRTAATILDDEKLTARQIADVLGHSRPSTTQDHYLGRGTVNAAAAAILDSAFRQGEAADHLWPG
jgi:integrase